MDERGAASMCPHCSAKMVQYKNSLVSKADPTNKKGGEWKVTDLGERFVTGEVSLRKHAWVYRGEVVTREGDKLFLSDVVQGYKYRPDYVRESRARCIHHGPELL